MMNFESSEARIAKDALRISEETLRSLFSHMSAGFAYCRIVLDSNGNPCDYVFLDINDACERLLEIKAEDVNGKMVTQVFPGIDKDSADWIGKFGQVALTGKPVRFESYSESLNKWYSVSACSTHRGFFAVTFNDVTDSKKTEEALLANQAHLSAILESVPVLTLMVDAERRVLELNNAAVGFSGRPIAEIVGLRGGEALGCLHSLDDPRGCGFGPACQTCQVRLAVLDTIETGTNHYKVEWRLPFMHNGKVEEMTFLFSTTRLPTSEKQALICIDDITDLKKIEMEVRQLNETLERRAVELEAANRELEAFSYSVSHDLRAPLRSMAGFSDALLEDYGDRLDEQGKQYLNWIKESGEVMGQLIDDLLQLSRVTRAEMRREPVDLSSLAETILAELERTNPERKVERAVARGLTCYGDSRLMRLVLENLLENAWKFTGKVPSPRIEVSVTERDSTCAFFVRDNGAGFNMKYADKLFRPFQRLHLNSEYPGTGIGLATVQRIIHRHGGRVWAEGKENEGATFYFALD